MREEVSVVFFLRGSVWLSQACRWHLLTSQSTLVDLIDRVGHALDWPRLALLVGLALGRDVS